MYLEIVISCIIDVSIHPQNIELIIFITKFFRRKKRISQRNKLKIRILYRFIYLFHPDRLKMS